MPARKEFKLAFLPETKEDILALPSQRLREIALERITDIRLGRLRGVPLEDRARTGPLGDCLKVYFDEVGGPDPRFRIVYRELSRGRIEVAEIVAVEQRQDGYVYLLSASRLGRLPTDVPLPPRPTPERRRSGGRARS